MVPSLMRRPRSVLFGLDVRTTRPSLVSPGPPSRLPLDHLRPVPPKLNTAPLLPATTVEDMTILPSGLPERVPLTVCVPLSNRSEAPVATARKSGVDRAEENMARGIRTEENN